MAMPCRLNVAPAEAIDSRFGTVLNDPLARGQLHHGTPYVYPEMVYGEATPGLSALGVGCL